MTAAEDYDARVRAAFAERLQLLFRERPGLTHKEFVTLSGIPMGTLAAYVRGLRSPGLTNLLALRRGFGLGSVEELLGKMPSQLFPPT